MSARCDRCGRELPEDALRYVVEIQITADVAPTLDLDISDADLQAALEETLARAEAESGRELERQVHERLVFLLCPPCRGQFARDPLGTGRAGKGAVH